MTPCALIERASSASDSSSMRVRGWYFPTPMRSSGRDCRDSPAEISSEPASSASSPRPSPFNLAMQCPLGGGDHILVPSPRFHRQREIRQCTFGSLVELQRGDTVAGRFGESNVAWDHRAIELFAEVLLQIRGHVERKRVARVVHGTQQALDFKARVQMRAHLAYGLHQVGKSFERVVLA